LEKPADYADLVRVLAEALDGGPLRLGAFVLMPHPWHFVLGPVGDRQLTDFCR
jgi:hypothetical protein